MLGHGWLWWACHACCFFVRVVLLSRQVGGTVTLSELTPGEWGEGPVGLRARPGPMAGSRLADFKLKS